MAPEERAGTDAQEISAGHEEELPRALNRDQLGAGVSSLGVFRSCLDTILCPVLRDVAPVTRCGPSHPDPSWDLGALSCPLHRQELGIALQFPLDTPRSM